MQQSQVEIKTVGVFDKPHLHQKNSSTFSNATNKVIDQIG
jgi:hypothetical protein